MEAKNQIGYELRETNNHVRRHMDQRREKEGFDKLTFAQGGIVHYLFRCRDQDVYQKDLEAEFGIRRSTATGLLNKLEESGYIERHEVKEDKRLKKITLTQKAMETEEHLKEMFLENEALLRKGFTDEEVSQLVSYLHRIRKNLEEEGKGV